MTVEELVVTNAEQERITNWSVYVFGKHCGDLSLNARDLVSRLVGSLRLSDGANFHTAASASTGSLCSGKDSRDESGSPRV